jgi:hypothetical protein
LALSVPPIVRPRNQRIGPPRCIEPTLVRAGGVATWPAKPRKALKFKKRRVRHKSVPVATP